MKLLELPQTLNQKIERLLQPIRLAGGTVSSAGEEERHAWRQVIEQLTTWSRDPGQLDDEGVIAPSVELLTDAMAVAELLRDSSIEPPDIAPAGKLLT